MAFNQPHNVCAMCKQKVNKSTKMRNKIAVWLKEKFLLSFVGCFLEENTETEHVEMTFPCGSSFDTTSSHYQIQSIHFDPSIRKIIVSLSLLASRYVAMKFSDFSFCLFTFSKLLVFFCLFNCFPGFRFNEQEKVPVGKNWIKCRLQRCRETRKLLQTRRG